MGEVIRKNYSAEEVAKIVGEFPIELFGNRVVVTVNTEESDKLQINNNTIAVDQYVIAAGSMARNLQAGDKVELDLKKLMSRQPVGHDQYQIESVLDIEPYVYGEHTFALITDHSIKGKYKNV